jgi:hypothetical protein
LKIGGMLFAVNRPTAAVERSELFPEELDPARAAGLEALQADARRPAQVAVDDLLAEPGDGGGV